MADALYQADGDRFVPTEATIGPWDRDAQHGGPAAALLARAVEQVESPVPMQVTRLTYDLLRPVPMRPLEVRTEVVRTGKRISVVEAGLYAEGTLVMRVSALRIRTAELELPAGVAPDDVPPLPVGEGEEAILLGGGNAYNDLGIEIRFLHGGFQHMGPGTAWTRLRLPVLVGEVPSPLVRACAAADLGNGVSSVLKQKDWLYINPDLTVHLSRMPVGEWIAVRAVTHPGPSGAGMAESALYDSRGRIGRSVQSLLLDRR